MNQTKKIWSHEKNEWPHEEDAFGLCVATHAQKRMRPHENKKGKMRKEKCGTT
jgi:hypothetical protein